MRTGTSSVEMWCGTPILRGSLTWLTWQASTCDVKKSPSLACPSHLCIWQETVWQLRPTLNANFFLHGTFQLWVISRALPEARVSHHWVMKSFLWVQASSLSVLTKTTGAQLPAPSEEIAWLRQGRKARATNFPQWGTGVSHTQLLFSLLLGEKDGLEFPQLASRAPPGQLGTIHIIPSVPI